LASIGTIRSNGSLLLGHSNDVGLFKEVSNDRFKLLSSYKDIMIYENQSAFGRWFFVDRVKWCTDGEDALQYIKLHANEMSNTVVLEDFQLKQFEDVFEKIHQGQSYRPSTTFERGGVIKALGPVGKLTTESALDLQVEVSAPCLMVISDLYYPGWNAFLDGINCPIYRADYIFRAVQVPAGKHHIRFEYQPKSFFAGSAIFAITISMIVIAFVRQMLRHAALSERP